MAGSWFAGLGQTIVGGLGTAFTLGLNDDVINWTEDGARKISNNAEKAWGADGEMAKFLEAVPVAGYLVSASHGIVAAQTGDERDLQRARRACAASTKSTLVTGGAIGGCLLGGPAGAAAGAALGSGAGQCSEKGINHANDKEFQTAGGTFHDFKPDDFAVEILIDGALGGVSALTTATAGKAVARKAVGSTLKELGGGGVKRYVAKRGCEQVITKPVTKVAHIGLSKIDNLRK